MRGKHNKKNHGQDRRNRVMMERTSKKKKVLRILLTDKTSGVVRRCIQYSSINSTSKYRMYIMKSKQASWVAFDNVFIVLHDFPAK